jgi:hypothetical protein
MVTATVELHCSSVILSGDTQCYCVLTDYKQQLVLAVLRYKLTSLRSALSLVMRLVACSS